MQYIHIWFSVPSESEQTTVDSFINFLIAFWLYIVIVVVY